MTDPESISLGGSLPQWMRTRPDMKYDTEGGTSFSPPTHDDSFFYIRYPIGQDGKKSGATSQIQSLTEALGDAQLLKTADKGAAPAPIKPRVEPIPVESVKKQQFAKHTEPCKMFMTANPENPAAPLPTFAHVKNLTKPFGTDDGFDGEGAACGTSIVRVARQMVSGKSLSRGFTVANFAGDLEAHPDEPNPDDQQAADLLHEQRYRSQPRNQTRRGSRSLPASPLGSPKSMRKAQPNPYFCGTGFGFGAAAASSSSGHSSNRTTASSGATGGGGWFLSGLLGYRGSEVASSTNSVVSNISEEVEEAHDVLAVHSGSTGAAGGTSGGSTATKLTAVPNTAGPSGNGSLLYATKSIRAKPSELREMNFWSPTSM